MTKFRRILMYILDLESNPKRVPLSEEDLQLAAHLIDLGESIDKGEYVITTEERLQYSDDDSKDLGWTPEDEECHKIKEYPDVVNFPGAPNLIQFSIGEFVELSKVKEAVEYYGSRQKFHNNGNKIRPSLTTMCHKYRFIRNESHLLKLRQYELNGVLHEIFSDCENFKGNWSTWKDTAAIDAVKPPSNKLKILTIPAGCTGNIQPCDVGIFGNFKKVVKTITNYAQLTHGNYKIHTRDETLKLLSLVWHQMCSPKLESWARYAWHASGYDVRRPSAFETPSQLLFPCGVARDCDISGCSSTSFIRCIHCEKYLCFKDFVFKYHMC